MVCCQKEKDQAINLSNFALCLFDIIRIKWKKRPKFTFFMLNCFEKKIEETDKRQLCYTCHSIPG